MNFDDDEDDMELDEKFEQSREYGEDVEFLQHIGYSYDDGGDIWYKETTSKNDNSTKLLSILGKCEWGWKGYMHFSSDRETIIKEASSKTGREMIWILGKEMLKALHSRPEETDKSTAIKDALQ